MEIGCIILLNWADHESATIQDMVNKMPFVKTFSEVLEMKTCSLSLCLYHSKFEKLPKKTPQKKSLPKSPSSLHKNVYLMTVNNKDTEYLFR